MSTQQVKELFNGTNYQSWSVDMRAILEANGVWRYVENPPMACTAAPAQAAQPAVAQPGAAGQPAAAQPAVLLPHQIPGASAVEIIEGLLKNIDKAAGLIKSNMEHSFSPTTDSTKIADSIPHIPLAQQAAAGTAVTEYNRAYLIWFHLQRTHVRPGMWHEWILRSKLRSFKMTGEVDIRVQIREMRTLKEEYEAATNRRIHDNEFIMDIADALPQNYNNVVSTIFASLGMQVTLTDFQDRLIQEWDRRVLWRWITCMGCIAQHCYLRDTGVTYI